MILRLLIAATIMGAIATGVLTFRAATTPEPDWYVENTIARKAEEEKGRTIRIRARVAGRDFGEMRQRIETMLHRSRATYDVKRNVHHRFNIETTSRQTAETLAALHAGDSVLTAGYAQWPNVANRPALEQQSVYKIRLHLRSIHPSATTVRSATATGLTTVALLIATAVAAARTGKI